MSSDEGFTVWVRPRDFTVTWYTRPSEPFRIYMSEMSFFWLKLGFSFIYVVVDITQQCQIPRPLFTTNLLFSFINIYISNLKAKERLTLPQDSGNVPIFNANFQ
jgi:hypothetical protein